jgi:hypothetical protein
MQGSGMHGALAEVRHPGLRFSALADDHQLANYRGDLALREVRMASGAFRGTTTARFQ